MRALATALLRGAHLEEMIQNQTWMRRITDPEVLLVVGLTSVSAVEIRVNSDECYCYKEERIIYRGREVKRFFAFFKVGMSLLELVKNMQNFTLFCYGQSSLFLNIPLLVATL